MTMMIVLVTVLVIVTLWSLSENDKSHKEESKRQPYGWNQVRELGKAGCKAIPLPPIVRNGKETSAAVIISLGDIKLRIKEEENWVTKGQWICVGTPQWEGINDMIPELQKTLADLAD